MSDLINRLRGNYAIGPIMENGEPEFGYRTMGEPTPIMLEAADALEAALSQQEAVGVINYADHQNASQLIDPSTPLRMAVEETSPKSIQGLPKGTRLYTHPQPAKAESCDCADKSQCWEPCGELGNSEEHVKVSDVELSKVPQSVEEFIDAKGFGTGPVIDSGELLEFMSGKVLVDVETIYKADELASAIKGSINFGRSHAIEVDGDDEPQYPQRKEWVEWVVDLATEYRKLRPAHKAAKGE